MRLAGLLVVAGVSLVVAAAFTVSVTVGLAVAGLGLLWLARQVA